MLFHRGGREGDRPSPSSIYLHAHSAIVKGAGLYIIHPTPLMFGKTALAAFRDKINCSSCGILFILVIVASKLRAKRLHSRYG